MRSRTCACSGRASIRTTSACPFLGTLSRRRNSKDFFHSVSHYNLRLLMEDFRTWPVDFHLPAFIVSGLRNLPDSQEEATPSASRVRVATGVRMQVRCFELYY